jgi:hypothetical protein
MQPFVSDWRNYEAWQADGSVWTVERAHRIYKQILADFEEPPMDAAAREELADFAGERRKAGRRRIFEPAQYEFREIRGQIGNSRISNLDQQVNGAGVADDQVMMARPQQAKTALAHLGFKGRPADLTFHIHHLSSDHAACRGGAAVKHAVEPFLGVAAEGRGRRGKLGHDPILAPQG